MSETFQVRDETRGEVALLRTEGYINNLGGEEIAKRCYGHMDQGRKILVLNLAGSKVVNSIGISILIEIIEKIIEIEGRLAFCGLTPTIAKTFQIMGLAQYSSIFDSETDALAAFNGTETG